MLKRRRINHIPKIAINQRPRNLFSCIHRYHNLRILRTCRQMRRMQHIRRTQQRILRLRWLRLIHIDRRAAQPDCAR